MISRINLVMQTKNLTASQFADEIGVQRSSMSHILSGRNNPSLDFVMKILNRFPEIRTDWIVFGKGSMYESEQQQGKNMESRVVKELDLFSNEAFEDFPEGNETQKESNSIQEDTDTTHFKATEEKAEQYPVQSSVNKPVEREEVKYSTPEKGKSIKKMIILFSDNTFEELVPENK